MMTWHFLHKGMTPEALGYLPGFLDENDQRGAREQFQERYVFGGWSPFPGFKMGDRFQLLYPGDPPTIPLAWTLLRDERIVFYQHSWVAVIQPDGSFEVSRMD